MIRRFINPGFGVVLLLFLAVQVQPVQAQAQTFSQNQAFSQNQDFSQNQVRADEPRYGSWSPPSVDGSQVRHNKKLQNLLRELNALIDAAQRDRAASRLFLRDLKDLTARYANAWPRRLLFENFTNGDYTRDPIWSVTSGDYFIEQGYGLRARAVTAPANQETKDRKLSKEQLAISILGAVLSGGKNVAGTVVKPAPSQPKLRSAVIEARVRVSNAFAVDLQLSSWKSTGRFAVAVTQGLGNAGYRVVYVPGPNRKLELFRITDLAQVVIDSTGIASLEDKKMHSLRWTRTKDGTMTVSIDGKQRLSARDQSFRDPFDAVLLSNQGTDVIVKSITVTGTP